MWPDSNLDIILIKVNSTVLRPLLPLLVMSKIKRTKLIIIMLTVPSGARVSTVGIGYAKMFFQSFK